MKQQAKKLLRVLLTLVMLIGLLPTAALAASEIDKVELTCTRAPFVFRILTIYNDTRLAGVAWGSLAVILQIFFILLPVLRFLRTCRSCTEKAIPQAQRLAEFSLRWTWHKK